MNTNVDAETLATAAVSTLAKLGVDFTLTPPSEYRCEARCTQCGHKQYPYAINPEFENTPEGRVMVKCYVGSSGDFCDRCEARGEETCMTMELIAWGDASQYEDEQGNTLDMATEKEEAN